MSTLQKHHVAVDLPGAEGPPSTRMLDSVVAASAKVGHSAVEIGGWLEDLGQSAKSEQDLLTTIDHGLNRILQETGQMERASKVVLDAAAQTQTTVARSVKALQTSGERTHRITDWVSGVQDWMSSFMSSLAATQGNLDEISDIAREVKILALNARIEAARAGDAGAGFSVIAGAIGQLAGDTSAAADGISRSLARVKQEADLFANGATAIVNDAGHVMAGSKDIDQALVDIQRDMSALDSIASDIGNATLRVREAVSAYAPDVRNLEASVRARGEDIAQLAEKSLELIDTSEGMVQKAIALGGQSSEQVFIDRVRADAEQLSRLLEAAVDRGEISEVELFSQDYRPVPGTNPQQFVAPFTRLTDRIFPQIQEAALALSDRVVFCAAVDRNGYLPTHNAKFSKPQGNDPVWNASNSRNRRMFKDRVGLKAGRNKAAFLLQVYRRDMGGGNFRIMFDVSAPVTVRGKHWGGLRLAFL